MSRKWSRRNSGPPFVQLHHWMMRTAAWRDLQPNDRCVYIAIKERYNGSNNGLISFSARDAGESINASHHTGNRSLIRLVEHGFIVITEERDFNSKVKLARMYRLTELGDNRPGVSPIPTKDFVQWKPKIQNTVSSLKSTVAPMRLRVVK